MNVRGLAIAAVLQLPQLALANDSHHRSHKHVAFFSIDGLHSSDLLK